ncbi:MAG: 16S rRNA (cytidine(1402)-2'-O)-methyltransferase [Chromatiaceae bacterium]|nr:16S rRNA (cytidine(1402)-2'-O)-methyltransferase [Chromatiaceae bacterium]
MQQEYGILYVVATPIGNLGDISERARRILAEVDCIAAEDTRETKRLLAHLGISTPLLAYHEHNERAAAERLLETLAEGRSIALVSDAGTPLISDPGYPLVSAARARGIRVVPVPGPSALICALSASGLPSDRFLFLGFPPRTETQRRAWFDGVKDEPGTLILYESPKRAVATLADLEAVLGDGRRLVLARELTKRFETFLTGSPSALRERLRDDPEQQLGELVMLIEGRREAASADSAEALRVLAILAEALPLAQAAALTARITGGRKNALYRLGLEQGLGR